LYQKINAYAFQLFFRDDFRNRRPHGEGTREKPIPKITNSRIAKIQLLKIGIENMA
jgi:hypothetical protein